ncbi:lytic transglycosylase domain-containing protein [Polyangium mundeleinium]|uniref:Transglycosylase SLT domain-containing protein n=1 Tax=Polyangium mundeleinium TaxID=2995306 RepID=A0ABT5EI15_9BACT|nr:lytic transglycosylase domain-containing protein [Polyangium mundeleinium]MDC0741452.1 transglycosylase SLT domain-containing protein [Polyangium mundeleinium]
MRFPKAARVFVTAGWLLAGALVSPPSLAQPKPAPVGVKPAAAKPAAAKPAQKPKPQASAKPAQKPAAKKPAGKKPLARKPGEPGEPDENARRAIAGLPPTQHRGVDESAELRALRELDLALFSPAPNAGAPWPSDDLPTLDRGGPVLLATGVPPSAPLPAPLQPPAPADLSFLKKLDLPDIPVRWDARVLRYLEFYKNNPRGRSMVASWVKKSGRYGAAIRRVLREQGLPEDVVWLALVESGFDPTIHSPVGAAGLWQFMPEGARIYGLTVDRWIDERLDPERSTLAAARYLSDLHRRFGTWELAFAAYNMGYGGLLASIRKYNTNDFWELSRLEAGLPLETALYVPKIVSMAIVAKNCAVFGCDGVEPEPAITFDKVAVGPGVALRTVATAAGVDLDAVEDLNPQLPVGRTPPLGPDAKEGASFVVRVPPGTGARAAKTVAKLLEREDKLERHLVRWGESIEDIAALRGTTKSTLLSLNGLRSGEQARPGTVLLVPEAGPDKPTVASVFSGVRGEKPVIVVPAEAFAYSDRRRVFYRVVAGDTAREVASALSVSAAELARWNTLDASAALHDGMTLQVFVPRERALANALVLEEPEARVLPVGSTEFFTHFENLKGRKRLEIAAGEGDTWRGLSKRYNLSLGMLERINHRSRTSPLAPGDKVVVYVAQPAPPKAAPAPAKEAPDDKAEAVAVAAPVEDKPAPSEDLDEPKPESKPAADEGPTKPATFRNETPPAPNKPAPDKPVTAKQPPAVALPPPAP